MSVKVMDVVWHLKMPPNEKLVLLAYADHAAHDGTSIFPAVAWVATKTGYSAREVQRVTRTLEKKGLLVSDGTGPRGTNRWRCEVEGDNLSRVTSEGVTSATAGPHNSSRVTPGAASCAAQGGDNSSPATSEGVTSATPGADNLSGVTSEGVTSATAGDDVGDSGGMTPVSPEPSFNRPFNHHESEGEEAGTKIKNVYTIFGEEIGLLTPGITDELDEACRVHGEHWLVEALKIASRNGKRNWAYAKAILGHWRTEGYGSAKKSNYRSKSPVPAESRGAAVARAWLAKQEA